MEVSDSRLKAVGERPGLAITRILGESGSSVGSLEKRLEGLNPLNVLGRGYTMVTSDKGEVITSLSGLETGDIVRISMRDGSASAEIRSKEMKE